MRRLGAAPVNSLLYLLAIGVALALPAGGQMLLANAVRLAGTTSTAPQISIFMTSGADRGMATEIESRLKKRGDVKRIQFLPREETLARMKTNPGLREVIEALPANPFPDAFVLTAADERPQAMEQLAVEFRQWPKVEHVQLDSAWVRRLDALLKLGRTAVLVLGALLSAGLTDPSHGNRGEPAARRHRRLHPATVSLLRTPAGIGRRYRRLAVGWLRRTLVARAPRRTGAAV
jgi:cell division transport system permease protein